MSLPRRTGIAFLVVLGLLCVVLTLPAAAQSRRHTFSITPLAGVHYGFEFGDLLPLPNTADIPAKTILLQNESIALGFHLGLPFSRYWEFQGTFVYNQADVIEETGPGLAGIPLGSSLLSSVELFSSSANLVFNIPVEFLNPFLTAGTGAVFLKPGRLLEKTMGWLINFGGGFRLAFSRHLQPVVEIRDYVSFFDFSRDLGLIYPAIYTARPREVQHSLAVHAGLSFLF